MRFLSKPDCASWCTERFIPLSEGTLKPDLEEPDFNLVKIPFPKGSGKKVAVARFLYKLVEPASETLLWLDNWSVFRSSEHMPLFHRFRQALGEERELNESPGHLVTDADKEDAISIIAMSLLFFWDCHAFTETGDKGFKISHDEYCWFASRDAEFAANLREKVAVSKMFNY